MPLRPHVARIDAVFIQSLGALGIAGQKEMAVVVEVADDGRGVPVGPQLADDCGHRLRRFVVVHRDADDLASRIGQLFDLSNRRLYVRSIGVGHRLHHDGMGAADLHAADVHGDGSPPRRHTIVLHRKNFLPCFTGCGLEPPSHCTKRPS